MDNQDLQLRAWNGAFWDMGFKWQWDEAMFRELSAAGSDQAQVKTYVERHHPHLLSAYDAEALAQAIYNNKTRRLAAMTSAARDCCRVELTCNGLRAG